MASFLSFLTTKKFPSQKTIQALLRGPLTGLSAAVYGLLFLLCGAACAMLILLNNKTLVTVPAKGGNLTEGVIGAARFINPLLATTDTDNRLVALVYGNLMQETATYTVSPDGKTYTLSLLPHITFSDGKPLTSSDVAFTVQKMQDVTISHTSAYWEAIAVEATDPTTVTFTLQAPDTDFLSHLSFAVMPKHVWDAITDDAFDTAAENLKPVGAGPFKVSAISYQAGIPKTVTLRRNTRAIGPVPLLRTLTIASYANQSALFDAIRNDDVDFSFSLTPSFAAQFLHTDTERNASVPTGNSVALYSNTSSPLANSATMATVSDIVDKSAIIDTVLHGYGTPLGGLANTTDTSAAHQAALAANAKKVQGFSLAVENDPTLLSVAQALQQQLQALGVTVSVKAFDPGTFQRNVTAGTFPIFLARSNSITIPSQYSVVLPLYTENQSYIFNTNTHLTIPRTVESPTMEYGSVADWYTRTDKLWRWLIHPSTSGHVRKDTSENT